MSPVRLSDLPKDVQKRVAADLPAVRKRPSRRSADGPGLPLRCECGVTFETEGAMNRHPAGPGHGRVEVVLG